MFDRVAVIDNAVRNRMLKEILVVEAIDTVIMLIVLSLRVSPQRNARPSRTRQIASWLAAIPILVVMLSINYGYHWVLRHVVGLPCIEDDLTAHFSALSLLVTCIQPALVEEAYCRLFVLDCLLSVSSLRAAVWISATMFAFLHIALLPSLPYLILFGAVLAYLRLSSGTLLLPMMAHFLHNLSVMLIGGF